MTGQGRDTSKSHAQKDSVMFEKVMPMVLIVLGIVTIALIGFAAALLLGFIHV